jgi:hypothetical protein
MCAQVRRALGHIFWRLRFKHVYAATVTASACHHAYKGANEEFKKYRPQRYSDDADLWTKAWSEGMQLMLPVTAGAFCGMIEGVSVGILCPFVVPVGLYGYYMRRSEKDQSVER